ncbi:hypothetical protein BSG1_15228 [Bacillus sp. SG-1]|nr:hypothetical protein BSG1_15228 [Bacillus sp. SG-1]
MLNIVMSNVKTVHNSERFFSFRKRGAPAAKISFTFQKAQGFMRRANRKRAAECYTGISRYYSKQRMVKLFV